VTSQDILFHYLQMDSDDFIMTLSDDEATPAGECINLALCA